MCVQQHVTNSRRALCLGALIASLSAGHSCAQVGGDSAKRIALLVGVNQYDRRGFRDLEYAERDVEQLAKILRGAGYEVHLLTGSNRGESRATLRNIQATMDAVFRDLTKRDLVLVALAGHGVQREIVGSGGKRRSESFFCPADVRRGEPQTMLAVSSLISELDRRGGGWNMVMIDACREDPSRGRGLDGSTVEAPEGVAVLFGCRSGQRTFESSRAGGGHGVFFYFVLEALRGRAKNERGEVTWSRLAEFVSRRVPSAVRRWVGRDSIRQTPNEIKNLPGPSPALVTLDANRLGLKTSWVDPLVESGYQDGSFLGTISRDLYKPDARGVGLDRTRGLLVELVLPETAAQRGGLKAGDVLLAVDDQNLHFSRNFTKHIANKTPGTIVQIKFWRNGREQTLPLKLGRRVDPDFHDRWLRKQAEQGNSRAQLALGDRLRWSWDHEEVVESVKWYRRAYANDAHEAAVHIALAYYLGRGVPKQWAQAVQWLQEAANVGSPVAQYRLGWLYRYGYPKENRDTEKAFHWFSAAAENDHRSGQLELGIMYAHGRGTPRNVNQAANWMRQAAEVGHGTAQALLGGMYAIGKGVPRDNAMAFEWIQRAAEQGSFTGQTNLGLLYSEGRGVEKDYTQAMAWFRKAADKGYAPAQYQVGRLYARGLVERDDDAAARWYRMSADQRYSHAQYALAHLHRLGRGVEKDSGEFVKWLRRAADEGYPPAQYDFGLAHARGDGVPQDVRQAVLWFRKAAEAGHARAQFNLAQCYRMGRGVIKDEKEAVAWYGKAAAQGHQRAKDTLRRLERQP